MNRYIHESIAIDVTKELEGRPSFEALKTSKGEKHRQKKMNMSFLYVVFLAGALFVMGYALVGYLKLQADITRTVENISYLETTLNNLTLANDDEYSKMINAVDFDEIRRVAIEELGMVYASEDQIITYTRENSDYVRQLNDLND